MPIVFGEEAYSIPEILAVFRKHGDKVRGTYTVRYRFGGGDRNPYAGASMERPAMFKDEDPHAIYPWESILVAAANCAGSDYPMIAAHWGIPLEAVDIDLKAVFDPRGEFSGVDPAWKGIPEAPASYQSFRWSATLTSSAPREQLERLQKRVLSHNMVLNALRAVPLTSELKVQVPSPMPGR